LKQIAAEEHLPPATTQHSNFHHSFLHSSLFWGRMNEMALMVSYEAKNIIAWVRTKQWTAIQKELSQQTRFFLSLFKLKRLHFGCLASRGRNELKRLAKHSRDRTRS
jgi:hypothetical protein